MTGPTGGCPWVLVGAGGSARLPRVRLYRRRAQEGRRGRQAQCVRQAPARPLSCPLLDGGFCGALWLSHNRRHNDGQHLALPRHEAGRELHYFLRNSALCHVPRRLRALHVACSARQGRRRDMVAEHADVLACQALLALCQAVLEPCKALFRLDTVHDAENTHSPAHGHYCVRPRLP